jgi:hypothetical protein
MKDQCQCGYEQAEDDGVVCNKCIHGLQTKEFLFQPDTKKPQQCRGFLK